MNVTGDSAGKPGPGRPEDPIDEHLPIYRREFAQGLRDLRNECGTPSYTTLGRLAGRSASSLSAAASGRQIPTEDMTRAYVKACLRHDGRAEEQIRTTVAAWEARRRKAQELDDTGQSSGSVGRTGDVDEATRSEAMADGVRTAESPGESQGVVLADLVEEPANGSVEPGSSKTDPTEPYDMLVVTNPPTASGVTQPLQTPANDERPPDTDGARQREPVLTRRNALIGIASMAVGMGSGAILSRILPIGQASAAPEPPIRVTSSYLWYPEDDYLYAIPGPLSPDHEKRMMQTGSPDEWIWLINEAGAVRFGDAGAPDGPQFSRIEMSLQNISGKSVLVNSIKASVLRRTAPLAGALAAAGAEGEAEVVKIGFDLDNTTDTTARIIDRNYELGERYTDVKKIWLAPTEIVPLQVVALTRKYYTEWTIEFGTEVEGMRLPVVAPHEDDGHFRTTAFSGQYATVYEHDVTSWRVARIPGPEWKWGR
ncbi:hypothetical protein [Nonomuraea sp. KM90]|uniref:hypothetical protein n=1 Tax=Nonomuraea sp. KM90 TaxID=3457428 RepID=UPI003FCD62A2